MFGVDSSELAVVAILALIFIGPKDLPKVMRTVGYWVGRVRGMARHFTSGIENMVREAELEEMEKHWREENERIMQLHPPDAIIRSRASPTACRRSRIRSRDAARREPAGRRASAREAAAAVKDIDDTKQPLLEHLIELRRRLFGRWRRWSWPSSSASDFATEYLRGAGPAVASRGAGQAHLHRHFRGLFREVKVALFAALMLAFPVIATQLWRFVAPGLYVKEKKAFLPFLLMTPFFFAAGACFAYFVAMPWALHFLLSYQGNIGGIQQEALPGVGNYLTFVTRFLFGFGVGVPDADPADDPRARGHRHARAAGQLAPLRDRRLRRGRGGADAARRRLDADAAGAALRPLRIRDPRHPHHPLARGAEAAQSARLRGCRGPQTEEGPEAPPGGGRVGGSGPI